VVGEPASRIYAPFEPSRPHFRRASAGHGWPTTTRLRPAPFSGVQRHVCYAQHVVVSWAWVGEQCNPERCFDPAQRLLSRLKSSVEIAIRCPRRGALRLRRRFSGNIRANSRPRSDGDIAPATFAFRNFHRGQDDVAGLLPNVSLICLK